MNKRDDKEPPPFQESLGDDFHRTGRGGGLQEAIATTKPGFRRRVNEAIKAQDLTEILRLFALANYGERKRENRMTLRLGETIQGRVNAFCEKHPNAERTRLIEVALDRLLTELEN
jgi:hypothetical protein